MGDKEPVPKSKPRQAGCLGLLQTPDTKAPGHSAAETLDCNLVSGQQGAPSWKPTGHNAKGPPDEQKTPGHKSSSSVVHWEISGAQGLGESKKQHLLGLAYQTATCAEHSVTAHAFMTVALSTIPRMAHLGAHWLC